MKITGLHSKQKEITYGILHSDAKIHIINASRQAGKTHMLSKLAIILSVTNNNEQGLIVAPSYEQSRNIYDRIISTKNVDKLISYKKDSKPFEIGFFNGTVLKFRSADRPDFIRGGSYKFVILDELAFFKEGVFNTVIRPTTAAKKGSKIIVASTPKGKNNIFYDLYLKAKESDNYMYYFMKYNDNPYYDLSEVTDAKNSLPDDIFDQEYLGIFIDNGGVVFNVKFKTIESYLTVQEPNMKYYAGLDWGRVNDKTVLCIMNGKGDVVLIKKWKGQSWESIQTEIAYYLNIFKPITYGEQNGIGDPLNSDMRKKYPQINEFITSASSKREVIENLRFDMVQQNVALPSITLEPDLYTEFANYTFTINKTGIISYHHKPGDYHDDIIDSIAIANYSRRNHNKGTFLKTTANSFYN